MNSLKKVVVVGLDGLDPGIVEPMLRAGELPNLALVEKQGGYGRVRTTSPAQTPVAWSTFATGVNPGGHGIFDFVTRNPKTYLPDLAFNRYEQKNAFVPPRAVNLRRGTAVWDVLTKADIPATILRLPCTYPPGPLRGRMLSGMGVPDVRGGLGTSTFYTSNGHYGESGSTISVKPDANRRVATYLPGPLNAKTRAPSKLPIQVQIVPQEDKVSVLVEGQPAALTICAGQWSDWLHVKFKTGMFQTVCGMVRFFLVRTEPHLEIFASPVNFDPSEPPFPISTPEEYTARLAAKLGDFYTTGMVEEHDGLNDGRIDEAAFLTQCEEVWHEREQMMLHELGRLKKGLFYCLFDTPDRVQHMFWRFREPDHPANREYGFEDQYSGVIEEHYRIADRVVGRALEYTDGETLLVALSDHGFTSFYRGVNLNTWLHEKGLLTLADGYSPGENAGDMLRHVDWDRTKAYALGLAGIYVNQQGREAQGIVPPDEAQDLKRKLAAELSGLPDVERGKCAIRGAVVREDAYLGPYRDEAADVLVHCSRGYRTSWRTALGGVPDEVFEDNARKWSGDHIVDPDLVPGVLFMNRPFRSANAKLEDMAPTILHALGLASCPEMQGETILS